VQGVGLGGSLLAAVVGIVAYAFKRVFLAA